jgi:hypothetical protein
MGITRSNSIFFGQSDDPREVELIRSLVEKTRQGKIPWVKQSNALTATIPLGFQVNFVLGPLAFITNASWQLLTVRDASGSELVRVSNSGIISITAGGVLKSALVEAADELFTVVNGAAGDGLDRAINTIKKL